MAGGKEFVGLVPAAEKRPASNFFGRAGIVNLLRNNFTIETWMCFGAVMQSLLFLVGGRLALIPALAFLLYRAFSTYAMSIGLIHNTYMDGIIQKKFSTAFPDETGHYGNKPANNDVVVFLIGTRFNHPMGLLAPGAKELSDFFVKMEKDLDEHSEEFGFLGSTSWLNSSDRTTSSEIMAVCYFRTTEGLHEFAHSPYHRVGWDWWNRTMKEHPHLAIYHETYHVPKGNWESIYVNSHISGINSTTHRITDEMTGQDAWARPIVDASKGLLKTSAGRMGRSQGQEHEQYGY